MINEYIYVFLIWFICLLLVIIVLGIVEWTKFMIISAAITSTIINPIFCPNNTSNSLCALNPNCVLAIPQNNDMFTNLISQFACNLVGCLEYAFLKNKPGSILQTLTNVNNPSITLPTGMQSRTAVYFEKKLIGLICTSPSTSSIWVIFRGTQTANEWKEDLMIQQISSNIFAGLIHKGFLNIYMAIRDSLLFGLQQLNSDVIAYTSLYIAGHSLGGTCAQLLLQDPQLQTNLKASVTNKQVFLFGTPRLGNPIFTASQANEKIFRFINDADIVPTLPPYISPNLQGKKDNVFIYQTMQQQIIRFNDNRSSYEENHSLKVYLYFLKSQL
jgi:lipase (class 3)